MIWQLRALLLFVLMGILAGCEVVDAPALTPAPAPSAIVLPGTSSTTVPATMPPQAIFAQAMITRSIGDDQATDNLLDTLLQLYPEAAEVRLARFYLAESRARQGLWSSAADLLRPLIADPTDDALRAPAIFWLARCLESAGDHAAAAAMYQEYRDLKTPLEPYAALRQAAQYQAAGDGSAARSAYEYAARSDIVRGERAGSFERAIDLAYLQGNAAASLDLYDELLGLAENPTYRARILMQAATLAQEQGQNERALAWLRQIVTAAPATGEAVAAAMELSASNDPAASPAVVGQIFMHAERWAEAVAQFDLAIPQTGDLEAGVELRRLRGLALRAQGDFASALAGLAEAGALSPHSEAGRQAQLDWIQTLGQSGEVERASQAYQEYANAYPDDPRAAEALERAAQLRERLGDTAGALAIRRDLGYRYPQSEQGSAALHRVGLDLFGSGNYAEARTVWQVLAEQTSDERRAQGAFWAGRAAQAQGDTAAATDYFRSALAAAPESYYGARADDMLAETTQGRVAFDAPITDADWEELRTWVRTWPNQTDLPTPNDLGVESDSYLRRAILLAEVGLANEARNEWLAALERWGDDPARLVELARQAHDQNATYVALRTAARLNRLAPADATPPPVLTRLLFPTPYAALVTQQSAERGLDPRLLYALLRQESLFDPLATSWVGARGLAQVMPETGQGIAQNLGVTDFHLDDLYRPVVSVRFGAHYIAARIGDMEGSIQAGLAAYNGGLGNALRWANGSNVADADLFTEGVDFFETRGYIKAVYGFYKVYQRTYAQP